jgi:tRNA pseudouridine38-40 synthase
MPTVRIDLGYDGSGFRGYARQGGQRTIQGDLERALSTLVGEVTDTAVAGRTDAGVHARGQVVSFVADGPIDVGALRRSLNGMLGPEIGVREVSLVEDGFHARHSARWRRYRYRIGTLPGGDPLTRLFTWEVGRELDVASMAAASSVFVGEHDFSSFCRSAPGSGNVRRVDESRLVSEPGVIEYWIRANAFCHQMVRSLVGHLYDVGRGFAALDRVVEVITAQDRSRVATVAPGHGLTLWEVGY